MQTNALPLYDDSVNTTGCCPKFNPIGWDNRNLHFDNKTFIRATTKSAMHIPINMDRVFKRVHRHIEDADAYDNTDCVVMSRDLSAWQAEHLFSVSKPVPDEDTTHLSGDFVTKVFEGPYRKVRHWHEEMRALARSKGGRSDEVYFFYTTCPECAKAYGQNYVVGIARL